MNYFPLNLLLAYGSPDTKHTKYAITHAIGFENKLIELDSSDEEEKVVKHCRYESNSQLQGSCSAKFPWAENVKGEPGEVLGVH